MTEKREGPGSPHFKTVDRLYIGLIILPLLCCMVLKILFTPPSEGISVTGALIYFQIEDFPLAPLIISETQVNSWGVVLSLLGVCLYMTHGLCERAETKRQLAAEWIVTKCRDLVGTNMGERYGGYEYLVAALMGLSACSSLSSLLGLFAPTGDINVTASWALLVFALVTKEKLAGGLFNYLKGYTEPIAVFTPLNVVSEFALPVSMAFRHYGNVMAGAVLSTLVAAALSGLSRMVLGWIPVIGEIPLLQIGIPGLLSIYFDAFSGLMQAFIFAMLMMLNVSGAFPEEAWRKRQEKKRLKAAKGAAA